MRRQRSKVKTLFSIAEICVSFTWQIVKTRVIRLWVIEGPNARDQRTLATYMRRMRNINLEIRIAGPLVARNDIVFRFVSIREGFVRSVWTVSLFHNRQFSGYILVTVRSEGFEDRRYGRMLAGRARAYIKVNGREYSRKRRGFDVVIVNRRTGEIILFFCQTIDVKVIR